MKGFKDSKGKFHPIKQSTGGIKMNRNTTNKTTGVLLRKSRVPDEFKKSHPEFKNWLTTGARYNALSDNERENILHEIGIPMDNFEPYTVQDVHAIRTLPYSILADEIKIRLHNKLGGVQDAEVGAKGYFPPVLRKNQFFNSEVERLKALDRSNLMGDILDIERIIKENIGWTYHARETPHVNKMFLMSLESLGLPSQLVTEKLIRDLDEANAGSLSLALQVIYDRHVHQPETVKARGLDV